ncbi:MAG: hypothetical protein ABIJ41_04590 [Candidatus Omnitrophota bacterium]
MKKIIVLMILLFTSNAFAQKEALSYDSHGRRDPFWRLVSPAGVIINYDEELLISEMILEGIIYDPTGSNLAIINGTVVRRGDKVGLYFIQKIERNRAILSKDKEKYIMELKKEE